MERKYTENQAGGRSGGRRGEIGFVLRAVALRTERAVQKQRSKHHTREVEVGAVGQGVRMIQ